MFNLRPVDRMRPACEFFAIRGLIAENIKSFSILDEQNKH